MGPNSKYISTFTLQKFIHESLPKAHGHTKKHRIDLVLSCSLSLVTLSDIILEIYASFLIFLSSTFPF